MTVITGMFSALSPPGLIAVDGRVPSKGLGGPSPAVSTIPVSQGECVSECESEVVP